MPFAQRVPDEGSARNAEKETQFFLFPLFGGHNASLPKSLPFSAILYRNAYRLPVGLYRRPLYSVSQSDARETERTRKKGGQE